MNWFLSINWRSFDWITPAIHAYAVVVFVLVLTVFFIHRARLAGLIERVRNIAALVEGTSPVSVRVRFDQLTGLILFLGDVVQRGDRDINPVIQFVRQEEYHRSVAVARTIVNVTETMIELFPILGILGTVWGISGVQAEEFSSERLLFLFGTATSTTLWALVYVVIFRITYAAFVQGHVINLEESSTRFQEFLNILEKRGTGGQGRGRDLLHATVVMDEPPTAATGTAP